MRRTWTIIGVADVARSLAWYQTLLGLPKSIPPHPEYTDVVLEVRAHLLERAEAAQTAGIAKERIVLDPGIGFGKTVAHNLELLRSGSAHQRDPRQVRFCLIDVDISRQISRDTP